MPKQEEEAGKKKYKAQKYVSDNEESDSDCVSSVYSLESSKKGIKINLELNKNEVNFHLDTRSACTIINEETYFNNLHNFKLKQTNVKLKSYTGDQIAVLGECTVPVKYDGGIQAKAYANSRQG